MSCEYSFNGRKSSGAGSTWMNRSHLSSQGLLPSSCLEVLFVLVHNLTLHAHLFLLKQNLSHTLHQTISKLVMLSYSTYLHPFLQKQSARSRDVRLRGRRQTVGPGALRPATHSRPGGADPRRWPVLIHDMTLPCLRGTGTVENNI